MQYETLTSAARGHVPYFLVKKGEGGLSCVCVFITSIDKVGSSEDDFIEAIRLILVILFQKGD